MKLTTLHRLRDALHRPSQLGVLQATLPDETSRLGAAFYVRAARNRRIAHVQQIMPRTCAALKSIARWPEVRDNYLAGQSGEDTDWFLNTKHFIAAMEREPIAGSEPVPGGLLATTWHEWTMFEASLHDECMQAAAGTEGVSQLRVNPTIEVLEYACDIAKWASNEGVHIPSACADPQQIAYYQHPESHRARWRMLAPMHIAVLQCVDERRPLTSFVADVAPDESAALLTALQEVMMDLVGRGIVIAATEPSSESREPATRAS